MPVWKLCEELTHDELQGWVNYFERRPIGWREDERCFKLLQAQGVKEKAHNLFASLAVVYNANKVVNEEGLVVSSLKGSQMFMNMLQATGGDTLNL